MSRRESELPCPAGRLRRELGVWYAAHRRALPWRETADPYAIWVSEIMLQQTTVTAVLPYWTRFIARFPDVRTLATAEIDDVLGLWSGLGYYRRARQLHAAAERVVTEHGGRLPESIERLRELPGIGPYTAAAIASIAFDIPEPTIDGNVTRVLARLCAIGGEVSSTATRRQIERIAAELLNRDAPGDHNQAVMELGATVCAPRTPSCPQCPWQATCVARRSGRAESYPQPKRREIVIRTLKAAALLRDAAGKVLFFRIPSERLNGGLLDLPSATIPAVHDDKSTLGGEPLRKTAEQALRHETGLGLEIGTEIAKIRHSVTRYRIDLRLFEAELARRPDGASWIWATPANASPLTGVARKALRAAGANPDRP